MDRMAKLMRKAFRTEMVEMGKSISDHFGLDRRRVIDIMGKMSGIDYENHIREILIDMGETVSKGAGYTSGVDLHLGDVGIEVKGNSSEGGQESIRPVNGVLMFRGRTLWGGRVPAFFHGNRDSWKDEKEVFKDVRIPASRTAVARYYELKGAQYIQVRDKGLYHTGHDKRGLGVPLFEADTEWRIRCKQHSGKVPGSVMAVLVFKRGTLQRSNRDLDWWQNNHFR